MASRWFAVMDSVGKTAGKGSSRWYVKDVAEKLKPVVELKVEREIGAGMEKLAQLTAAHAAWIKHADITWVLSLGNDLIDQAGRNIPEHAWPRTFGIISGSLRSMAEQFRHQRHFIVFGGKPEMWEIDEPHVFYARVEQVLCEGRRCGLTMVDARQWVDETEKADWVYFHLRDRCFAADWMSRMMLRTAGGTGLQRRPQAGALVVQPPAHTTECIVDRSACRAAGTGAAGTEGGSTQASSSVVQEQVSQGAHDAHAGDEASRHW